MKFAFLLLISPAAWAGPTVDPNVPMWTRAEYNAAIMTRLAGLPTDARQEQLLKLIGNDANTGLARPVEPIGDPAEREKLKAALGRDLAFLREALEHRRNLDMSNVDADIEMVKRFNNKHNGLITEFWPKSGAGRTGVPPPNTNDSLPPPPPEKTPGNSPRDTGFNPGSGPAGSPGGLDTNNPGKGSPNGAAPGGAAPNSDPGKTASDLNKLRGNFSKALGAAKDGAGSFDQKDDNLAAAPKPAGPQGQPGPQGQTPRPNQSGPENVSPEQFAPGNPSRPTAGTMVAGLPASAGPGGYAPSAFSARTAPAASPRAGFPSNAPAPENSRAPGAFSAGPGTASPGAGGPSLGALDPKVPEKKAPPGGEALTEAELAAIKDIQKMLGEASGETPLDTDALQKGAEKLDRAEVGAAWKGVDVNALRQQINQVIGMAGVQGTWSQEQIVYQAANDLGLSEVQAGRIIKSLRISEPPSPKLAGMTWWQRLLAWARHYKKVFMRRLL